MSTQTVTTHSTAFKIGWIALLVISALMTLGHIFLTLIEVDEAPLFIGWAAFNLYATVVLYVPFRRGEVWAWYTSWILVIAFASAIIFNTQIGIFYLGEAIVMAVALLLTRGTFFPRR